MLIKLLCSRSCVEGVQVEGDVVEVENSEARRLIESGQAEAVKAEVKRGAKKAETATKRKKVEKRG